MLKAVLFDAAGTLFHVRGSVGEVYATVAARHGVTVAPRAIESRFRAAFRAMPPLAFPGVPPGELPQREYTWWKQLVATVFSGERFIDFDACFRELFEYFAAASAWALFPDTQPALATLQAHGVRLGLVSNFDGRLPAICTGLGIAEAFDVIVMSSRAGYAKPDPRIFASALRQLGVDRARAIHVGDSEREDVEGARAAGVRPVSIVRDGSTDRAAAALPSDRVCDLRQLAERVCVARAR